MRRVKSAKCWLIEYVEIINITLQGCTVRTQEKIILHWQNAKSVQRKKAIGKQLRYIRRDMKYIDTFLACDDVKLTDKETELLTVLKKVYEQQLYMFENNTHRVADRIVSISQPYIRPIERKGKNTCRVRSITWPISWRKWHLKNWEALFRCI